MASFLGKTSASVTAQSVTVTMPSGVAIGEWVLVFISLNTTGAGSIGFMTSGTHFDAKFKSLQQTLASGWCTFNFARLIDGTEAASYTFNIHYAGSPTNQPIVATAMGVRGLTEDVSRPGQPAFQQVLADTDGFPSVTTDPPVTALATQARTVTFADPPSHVFLVEQITSYVDTTHGTHATPNATVVPTALTSSNGYNQRDFPVVGTVLSQYVGDIQLDIGSGTTLASHSWTAATGTVAAAARWLFYTEEGGDVTVTITDDLHMTASLMGGPDTPDITFAITGSVNLAGLIGTTGLGGVTVQYPGTIGVTGLSATGVLNAPYVRLPDQTFNAPSFAPVASLGTLGFQALYNNVALNSGKPSQGSPYNLVRMAAPGPEAVRGRVAHPLNAGSPPEMGAFDGAAFQPDAFQTHSHAYLLGVLGTGTLGGVIYQASYAAYFATNPFIWPIFPTLARLGTVTTSSSPGVTATGVQATGTLGDVAGWDVAYAFNPNVPSATSWRDYSFNRTTLRADPGALNDSNRTGDVVSLEGPYTWVPRASATTLAPQTAQIDLNTTWTVDKVIVYAAQRSIAPSDPTDSTTITGAGVNLTATVDVWTGAAWVNKGTITNSDKAKNTVSFAATANVSAVRVVMTQGFGLTEIEAYADDGFGYRNIAALSHGVSALGVVGLALPNMNVYLDVRGPPYNARLGLLMTTRLGTPSVTRTCRYTIPAGLYGTTALGTVTPTALYAVTGVAAAGAVGDVLYEASYPVLVGRMTARMGSFVAGWVQAPAVTGTAGIGQLGTPTPHAPGHAEAGLSVSGSGGVGQVGFAISSTAPVDGVVAIGRVGAVRNRVDGPVDVLGLEGTGTLGNVTPLDWQPDMGVAGTALVGAVGIAVDCAVEISGFEAVGNAGLVGETRSATSHVAGVQAVGTIGVIAPALQSAYTKGNYIFVRTQ